MIKILIIVVAVIVGYILPLMYCRNHTKKIRAPDNLDLFLTLVPVANICNMIALLIILMKSHTSSWVERFFK